MMLDAMDQFVYLHFGLPWLRLRGLHYANANFLTDICCGKLYSFCNGALVVGTWPSW